MSITYTTQITAVRVTSQDTLVDVVKDVDVIVTGQDGPVTFQLPTTVTLGPADPAAFTAYEAVTEDELIAWVEASPSLGPIHGHIAQVVAKEVARAALGPKPLPWAPVPEPAS